MRFGASSPAELALHMDSLTSFINEVLVAERGLGKVKPDGLKSVVDRVKANREVQIPNRLYRNK